MGAGVIVAVGASVVPFKVGVGQYSSLTWSAWIWHPTYYLCIVSQESDEKLSTYTVKRWFIRGWN